MDPGLLQNNRRYRNTVFFKRYQPDQEKVKLDAALKRIEHLLLCQKFEEDQPRVPAGSPEGGQWLGTNDASPSGSIPVDSIASIGGRALKKSCEAQLDRDIFQCRMVGLRSCYEQLNNDTQHA